MPDSVSNLTPSRERHPGLRADFVMALPSAAARSYPRSHSADRPNGRINPPFNIKEWWDGKLEGDARWNRSEAELASHAQFYKNRGKYGTPPQGNANFAWVQHMLHHLAPNGSMALLLANGSMSSNSSGELGYVAGSVPHLAPGEPVVELDSPRRLMGSQFPSEIFHNIKK